MTYSWFNSVVPIAVIFSFRMLGLFMLIPVFTVSAAELQDATPTLIGFALGSYGLSQGLLQIPFGMLSDRFGRKPILTLGLILFVCGSLLGAFSQSIYTMILARILQGTGAIGSVLIALLADLTPDKDRTKAMAVIGMTIGLSFSIAMIISPALTNYYGLAGLFYLTAILAFLGLILLHGLIPTPQKEYFHLENEATPKLFKAVFSNRHLQRLNIGIFFQHFILTSTFYALPLLLQQQQTLGHLAQQWHFYLPLMFFSFVFMIPFILLAEKKRQMKLVFLLAVFITSFCQLLLTRFHLHWFSLCTLMFFYFIAFNVLEAVLPSLVSKQAGATAKGTAMGIYSSSQFLGIFIGGAASGLLSQFAGNQAIFIANSLIGTIWLIIAFYMKPYAYLSILSLSYSSQLEFNMERLIEKLKQLDGVKEVVIVKDEQLIYIRIDKMIYKDGDAERVLADFINAQINTHGSTQLTLD